MDMMKLGAAGILAVAFAGALVVREQPASEVAILPLPPICGDVLAEHGGASMQAHIDMMAEGAGEAHAALLQTMEPMHSDMMRGMTAEDFQTAFVCSMIPHHQGAVEMAQVAQQYGDDPWVQMFAQEIITAQQAEIKEMQAWLARGE
ncbi:hypothetical protein GCM10007989_17200 [Devosia pacifica]|uniref:DUF305 domain-containing protein n=1 Tax=Devosia pacifica TaxID=1335967 RepID=A0A918VRI7_9HYPH|nr:DUF305 domain-containing protein [Devosia pacifica]GHA22366.1 hypothetical protein GCM10007989_17200 [Devosia pacifica]